MQRFFAVLTAAIAAFGLGTAALAQKAEAPKAEARKIEAPKVEATKAAKSAEPMDINTASEKELASLAGIGEVRAKAIIKGRPYKGKNELVDKKIVPQKVYDDIKDKIIAKQK